MSTEGQGTKRRWRTARAATFAGQGCPSVALAETGLRRVDWVRIVVDHDSVRAEAVGVGYRLPTSCPIPLPVAAALIGEGTRRLHAHSAIAQPIPHVATARPAAWTQGGSGVRLPLQRGFRPHGRCGNRFWSFHRVRNHGALHGGWRVWRLSRSAGSAARGDRRESRACGRVGCLKNADHGARCGPRLRSTAMVTPLQGRHAG